MKKVIKSVIGLIIGLCLISCQQEKPTSKIDYKEYNMRADAPILALLGSKYNVDPYVVYEVANSFSEKYFETLDHESIDSKLAISTALSDIVNTSSKYNLPKEQVAGMIIDFYNMKYSE